jgi:predicted SprT family Zn-dependent metalloprotease
MSLLKQAKRVLLKKDTGIVSFINEEGNSTHVLYIQKGYMIKDKDFKEIMESIEIKFKKKL